MSIVRQVAKAKEKEAKRLRNDISDVSNVATASNKVQAPKDPIQGKGRSETCLGDVDFDRVKLAVSAVVPNMRGKYQKYTDQERCKIGKYGSENGVTEAVTNFKKEYASLNESTVREMKK